jgi:hypothetical protein
MKGGCVSPKSIYLFAVLFTASAMVSNSAIADETILTEEKALNKLVELIKKDKLYSSRTKLDCMSFMTKKISDDYEIGIHEKHGGNCGGDSSTYPLIDRFKINRQTGKVFWFDFRNSEYVSYEEFKNSKWSR